MPLQMLQEGESYAERTQVYCQNFTLATRVDERLDLKGEWLCLWRLLGTYPAAGETYPLNYRYNANLTIYVRFDQPDNPAIPMQLGDIIRMPFKRVYLSTVIAIPGAVPAGTFDLLYGIGPIALEKGQAQNTLLLQDLLWFFEHGYSLRSAAGDDEVLAIAATTAATGANQACAEATFWTPDAQIYFTLGAGPATAADALLPANSPMTIPIANTNQLKFYNAAGGGATVYIVWRS